MGAGLVEQFASSFARRRFSPETTAFRLFNRETSDLAHVSVDWFDGVAVLSLYRQVASAEEQKLVEALGRAVSPRAIYLKRRPKVAATLGTRLQEAAPEAPAMGEAFPDLVVLENGLRFRIRPGAGLAVGLYLDAREVRGWVKRHSSGTSVLNCFAYTCGLGVAALAGGARKVVNVDLSAAALRWGEENASLNSVAGRALYAAKEVFRYLDRAHRQEERYDLVILDPPSFSTSREGTFSAAKDYPSLVASAARVVAKGGRIVACCNLASLEPSKFEAMVKRGWEAAGRSARIEKRLSSPSTDFPVPAHGRQGLRVAIAQIG